MEIYFLTRGGEQDCRQLPQNPFVRDILLSILNTTLTKDSQSSQGGVHW
jgi:hypothetical protein